MKIKKGIGVSPGVAIAQAVVLNAEEFDIPQRHVPADRAPTELARLRKATAVSKKEIQELRRTTAEKIDKKTAGIFGFHLMLLEDKELHKQFSEMIQGEHATAEYAVATVLRTYARSFRGMPQHLADRAHDVHDIEKRLLRHLIGQSRQILAQLKRDVVVVAPDLTPSQTAAMDRGHVRGIAMDVGGQTSHTAIVARGLGLPAVTGLGDLSAEVAGGDTIIIDGNRGVVILNPDAETLANYQQLARQHVEFLHSLDALRELPAATRDGHEVVLLGNIEFPTEASSVLNKGGQGIGLYRTEFLYLGSDTEPTEEDHYNAYRDVLHACPDRSVVIRTLDLGADKYTQRRANIPERNPMLGLRSIRFCLQNLPAFKTQIRAILRAAVGTRASMMFPLLTTLKELRQAKAIMRDVIEDLEEENAEFVPDLPVGIMVETPSAALQCDAFAQEVDFFSIGTNDLIQYTLAVDRGNERVASLFTPTNPAVLKLVKDILRAGQRHDIPVSMCGEMAGDPKYTLLLLGLGLRTFSISPPAIPEIKKIIRSVTMEQALEVARRVMGFDSEAEVSNYLRMETSKLLPEAFAD